MQPELYQWTGWLWLTFLTVWIAGMISNRRTIRTDSAPINIFHRLLLVGAYFLCFARYDSGSLGWRFSPPSPGIAWLGFSVTFVGLAFAVGARFYLGRNWSSSVTIKQDHTLACTGPYALVRHPIYTGILLGMLGTALLQGKWRSLLGVALAFCSFWIKSGREERFMLQQFGDRYAQYRERVKRLVPFVL